MSNDLDEAAQLLNSAQSIAVLTGAGVSAESGVPTFRGSDGLWNNFRAEELATPHAFRRDPALVWDFYNYRRDLLSRVSPNPAHHAIAELERRADRFTLITQNVDGLHRAAGSRHVLEVHGNIWGVRCTRCGVTSDRSGDKLPRLPQCDACGGLLRPTVVWFGESLPGETWQQAERAARECQCMLVVGTSALVHPAASLAWIAQSEGARVIEINVEPTSANEIAAIGLYGKAGEILPQLLARYRTPQGIDDRERINH